VNGLGLAQHRPLLAGREAGAASAQEAGRVDLLGDVLAAHGEGLAQALVAAVVQVRLQRPRPLVAEAGRDDLGGVSDPHQRSSPAGGASWTGATSDAATVAGPDATRPTERRTRHSVPWGGTSSARRPAARSSTRRSKLSSVTLPKKRQLTARHGACPHRAMHSTSSIVNCPSGVVVPALTPRRCSACSSSS